MSLSGAISPFSSTSRMNYPTSLGAVSSGSNPFSAASATTPSLLGQSPPAPSAGGSSLLGGSSPLGGGLLSVISQILQMVGLILQSLLGGAGGGAGGGMPSGGQPAGGSPGSGSGSSAPQSPNMPTGSDPMPSPSGSGDPSSEGGPNGITAPPGYSMTNGGNDTPAPDPSSDNNTSPPKVSNDAGWNKNVNVFASSDASQETMDVFSGGKQTGGYLAQVEDGMDQGKSLTQAHDGVHLDTQAPVRNNASPNSLVKGKGGNAVVVTGDGIDAPQANQFADKLRKDYGMNVKVIPNSSPNQLKAALQEMGQQKGQQAMVAVLAHGAKDDSGKNDGNIAMGKGDGDQWLHEDSLKSMVNQYLAPNYGNVNVVLNSCFSGNFVQ
jgi:hypothetical protein